MREKHGTVINIGTTSLIMIFAVLALVIFALLSYSSANVQWRMAGKMAERTTVYYEAERQAAETREQRASWMDQLAREKKQVSEREFELQLQCLSEQRTEWKDGLLCWQIPVEERQKLEIGLLPFCEGETVGWQLIRWKLMTEKEDDFERQTITLYGG